MGTSRIAVSRFLRFAVVSQESAEPSRIIGRDSMRGNELRQRRDDARNRYVLIIRRLLRIRRFEQLVRENENLNSRLLVSNVGFHASTKPANWKFKLDRLTKLVKIY